MNLKKYIPFFLLGILFFLSGFLMAQTAISGFVYEAETNEPAIGSVSDQNGYFELVTDQALPFGMVVRYLGFENKEVEVFDKNELLYIYLEDGGITTAEVVVSASRWKEKIQEAPASISVIPLNIIEAQVFVNPLEHLKYTAGVQLTMQGTERINIGMRRGGGGTFNTTTRIIADHRTMSSVASDFFDASSSAFYSLDMERIEVVRGPASALYGPGVTNGVVHFISKDPFKYSGTSVELTGGERATYRAAFRHAQHTANKKFGFKVNGNYRRSNEWQLDPNNTEDSLTMSQFFNEIIDPLTGKVVYETGKNLRKDNLGYGLNATLEYRPEYDFRIVASGGYNRYEGMLRSVLGEFLYQNNEYYGQIRCRKGHFFSQFSINQSSTGKDKSTSFFYRSGQTFLNPRTYFEGQMQYDFKLKALSTKFITGGEYQGLRTDSKKTIFGRYEDDDRFDVVGAFFQSKTNIFKQLDLTLAGRVDHYFALDQTTFSPRAALLYNIDDQNGLRLTYNKAFLPPTVLSLNLDFPIIKNDLMDFWALGGRSTQTFADNPFTTSFIPGVGDTPGIGLPLQVAYTTILDELTRSGILPDPLLDYLESEIPNINGFSNGETVTLDGNPFVRRGTKPLKIQENVSYEFGYSGTIWNRLVASVDVYYAREKNFILGPAQVSPLVITPDLPQDLSKMITETLSAETLANFGISPEFIAVLFQQIATNITTPDGPDGVQTPVGLIETEQMPEGGLPHLAFGFISAGKTSFWGSDLSLLYYYRPFLSFFGSYSWLSNNSFIIKDPDNEELDLGLKTNNYPINKFRLGIDYKSIDGLHANIRVQYDEGYYVDEGYFSGWVPARTIVDAGIGYTWFNWLSVDVTISNALNKKYRTYPGLPKIGRRILGRVKYSF
jgi:iron complex outermembrane receptor protein